MCMELQQIEKWVEWKWGWEWRLRSLTDTVSTDGKSGIDYVLAVVGIARVMET